jgi:hypothetical protein
VLCNSQIVSRWDIMERFEPRLFMLFALMAGSNDRTVNEQDEIVSNNPLPESARAVADDMASFVEYLNSLGLKASVASLERFVQILRNPDSTISNMSAISKELHGRLRDELRGEFYFSLTPSEAVRFENWSLRWEAVLARFPDATRDVEEMNKCFALSRYTASMFHALHVAEWGAIHLGRHIGVTDQKEGWGPTERKLRELVHGGHSNLPIILNGRFEFLEQINQEINSMVLAWRHKVDHAANHLYIVPNTDFTPDIAEHIIGAVRIFMQRLMEGIPA